MSAHVVTSRVTVIRYRLEPRAPYIDMLSEVQMNDAPMAIMATKVCDNGLLLWYATMPLVNSVFCCCDASQSSNNFLQCSLSFSHEDKHASTGKANSAHASTR